MSAITATLNGVALPPIEQDFVNKNIDNAVDVVTLSNDMYTDFVDNTHDLWTFSYDSMTKAEYDAIRAAYDDQYVSYQYPLLSIPFYSLTSQPVRMTINDKNIWDNCGSIQGVQLQFRETAQLPLVS